MARLLVDSGASEHVCRSSHFPLRAEVPAPELLLRTASGAVVRSLTAKRVVIRTAEEGMLLKIVFRVAPVSQPILSVARLGPRRAALRA